MNFEELNKDNLAKIKNGMIFKNRRDLCEYLGVEYATGGKRVKLQIEKIEHMFAYHKEGHKIIVDDVYPLVIMELNFQLSTDRQKQISELLILDLILGAIKNDDEALIINQNVLIPYLALANQNYIYYYYNRNNELAKKLGMEVDHIKTLDNWLQSVRGSLKSAIESAIKQLEKEGYILHNQVYKVQMVYQDNKIYVGEKLNNFGDKETEYKTENSEIQKGIRLATHLETNRILAIEQEVLRDLKMTKQDLYLQGKYDMFNKLCRDETIKQMDVGMYFKCHQFNYADGFIKVKKEEIIRQLQTENIEELKAESNRLMCGKVRLNAERRIERHNKRMDEIQSELDDVGSTSFGSVNKNEIRDLMQIRERQMDKDYLNTKEHAQIEEQLVEFLLMIEDINKDVKEVWYDTIKE